MNDIEQRIRELPLPGPSAALDERIADLLSMPRVARALSTGSRVGLVVGAALAAGLAGFAAGLGTSRWFDAPRDEPAIARPAAPNLDPRNAAAPPSFVQLTDARIGAGLDFSQSLEPFQVQPVVQGEEGS